jgi:nitrate reductase delta subunit
VLEFTAKVSAEDGYELLQRYRPSLELLRLSLQDDKLPHHRALALICDTLPGVSPDDRDAVMRMAGYGPPTESVGLDPYDPRLLPLAGRKSQ